MMHAYSSFIKCAIAFNPRIFIRDPRKISILPRLTSFYHANAHYEMRRNSRRTNENFHRSFERQNAQRGFSPVAKTSR